MEALKYFTAEQFEAALEAWQWIGLDGKAPLFATWFGDVVLQADDGFWWLDTVSGSLDLAWADGQSLEAELNTEAGQAEYLLVGLAQGAFARGLIPGEGEIFDFRHPPALGGELAVENLDVIDFTVGLNMMGQIHQQIRDLPPGTPISEIKLG